MNLAWAALSSLRMSFRILTLNAIALLGLTVTDWSQTIAPLRPKLQIINGSGEVVDIYWLKSDAERITNGSLRPGQESIINTTLGHRFVIVGRDDKREEVVTSMVRVQGYRFDPKSKDGVPSYYSQRVDAHGFPIVASAAVNPYALKEAAYILDQMLGSRPDVRMAMIRSGARLSILAHNEFTTDLPEFAHLANEKVPGFADIDGKDYWDARARGTGGSETDPFCSCAEENVLGYPGDPYAAECILIHEFAHSIHLRGMVNVDPTFNDRLKATFQRAMAAGLWKGKYAGVNHHEYFAEGVQSWFDNNRENDHDHNHVNTRAELIDYDPGLAAMCREVFGETAIHYTKPVTRLTGHLAGYDPSQAPRFAWPDRLAKAKAAISAQARSRNLEPIERETRSIAGWEVRINKKLLEVPNLAATNRALELLKVMLDEIIRVVPAKTVTELQKVPLYFSPEYPDGKAGAAFHPEPGWLREHGRDPAMAKGVEFTNVRIFEAETRRMPNFALHELAHAYHNRVLGKGFGNDRIIAAFKRAEASGHYDEVERKDSEGRSRMGKAYAMTNPMEYFAECSEAYFSRNDFYPFIASELKVHDPDMFALLGDLWGVSGP